MAVVAPILALTTSSVSQPQDNNTVTVQTDRYTVSAKKYLPANPNSNDPVIIFMGGFCHSQEMYDSFLQKLVIETGYEVLIFDTPGMGQSTINVDSATVEDVEGSLVEVAQQIYPNRKLILIGHSYGTAPVRDVYVDEGNSIHHRVIGYGMIGPIWSKEEAKRYGSKPGSIYYFANTVKLLMHPSDMSPTLADGAAFFQMHRKDDRKWLNKELREQAYDIALKHYLGVRKKIDEFSLPESADSDQSLAIFVGDHDRVCGVKRPSEKMTIVKGADHSFIAGQNVPQDYVGVVAKWIKRLPANEQAEQN